VQFSLSGEGVKTAMATGMPSTPPFKMNGIVSQIFV
jgi:hypothetical protein